MKTLELSHRYEPVREIGSGGGGKVYAVFDRALQKNLALKIFIPDDNSSRDEEAFFHEYLLALKLCHQSLIKIHDYGYTGGNLPFYTMDLLAEENIDDYLRAKDASTVLTASWKIAGTLAFLHFFNLIHNDLKPANLKPVSDANGFDIRFLDFGLALDIAPDSLQKRPAGTIEYMAPELFRSQPSSRCSDLYSLGVIFYKLIFGQVPFTDPDPLVVISNKLEKEPPLPGPFLPSLPQEFIDLTFQLLSRDPENRPESSYRVATMISNLLGDHVVFFPFEELLRSLVGIRLSRKFEKAGFQSDKSRTFAFEDEMVLERFCALLKAHLQKDFFNVDVVEEGKSNAVTSEVSPRAQRTIQIRIIRLKPDQTFRETDQPDQPGINLLLIPSAGEYEILTSCQAEKIEICAELWNWMAVAGNSEEIYEKLKHLCSDNLQTLATLMDDLQDRRIIIFTGQNWEIDAEGFIEYAPPPDVIGKIFTQLDFLPTEELESLKRLAVFNHAFDADLIVQFLRPGCLDPGLFLHKLVNCRILLYHVGQYSFRNTLLRVALIHATPPELIRESHLKAANLIEQSAGYQSDRKKIDLAWHYTLAGQLGKSVKWTIEACEYLVEKNKCRVAMKMILESLKLAQSQTETQDTYRQRAVLLASRGDCEKRLGLTQKSLATFARVVRMHKFIQDQEIIAGAYKNLGDIYKANHDFRRGLKSLQKALQIYRKLGNKIEISHTYNNIGNIYWVGSQPDLALENYFRALKIQEEAGLRKDVASTLNNVGSCYIAKGQLEKTIEYYQKSIEIKKEINDLPELARTYNNLGAIHLEIGNIPEALQYLREALAINRSIDSKREILYNLDNITSCELSLGQYQKAEAYSSEGLKTAQELADLPFQAVFLAEMGIAALHAGDFGKAEDILQRTPELLSQITDRELEASINRAFASLYINSFQEEWAWEHIEKALNISTAIDEPKGIVLALILKSNAWTHFKGDSFAAGREIDRCLEIMANIKSDGISCNLRLNELRLALLERRDVPAARLEIIDNLVTKAVNRTLKPEFLYYLAKRSLTEKLNNEAREYLAEASRLAEEYSQFNLLWRIKHLLGQVERELLNYEKAYLSYKKAVTILKSLALTLKSKEEINRFLSQPEAQQLKAEIGELSERMGRK